MGICKEKRGVNRIMKIAILPCLRIKAKVPCSAGDMYKSRLFVLRKRYAKEVLGCDKIYILSDKYGLIAENEIIEPYNIKLDTLSEEEYIDWQCQVITQYLKELYNKLMSDEEVEIYLFRSNSDYLRKFRQITTIDYDVEWGKNNKLFLARGVNSIKEASKLSKKEEWSEIYGKEQKQSN